MPLSRIYKQISFCSTTMLQKDFGHLHKHWVKVGINTLHLSGQTYTENKAKDVLNIVCFHKGQFKVTMCQTFHH